jgi:hypothetical protein
VSLAGVDHGEVPEGLRLVGRQHSNIGFDFNDTNCAFSATIRMFVPWGGGNLVLIAKAKLLELFGQVVILGVDTDEAADTLVGVLLGRIAEK